MADMAHTRLRRGEVIEIDGLRLVMDGDGEVNEGDLYVAERNQGPKLLTCKKHIRDDPRGGYSGWFVVPVELAYCYDTHECVRVKEA